MDKSYSYQKKGGVLGETKPVCDDPCKEGGGSGGGTGNNGCTGAPYFPDIPCENIPLAMAYVPMQTWRNLYDLSIGLTRGTIFTELDLPFIGEEAVPA